MRKPIIAANWKMHNTTCEAAELVRLLIPILGDTRGADVVLCPPFTSLATVDAALGGTPILLGAQNVHWEQKGAYTGEVSVAMLRDLGCRFVIIGHSERRRYFAETDETVNKKVKSALEGGLTPIVCVGETLEEREAGRTSEVCRRQVRAGLAGLVADKVAGLVIAYEPIWAIGTGRNASPEDAEDTIRGIRETIRQEFGPPAAEDVRIQYGGSVKPESMARFMEQPDIDGALVGGASLEADSFAAIVHYPQPQK